MLNWLTGSFPNTHWKARLHGNYRKRLKAPKFPARSSSKANHKSGRNFWPPEIFFSRKKGHCHDFFWSQEAKLEQKPNQWSILSLQVLENKIFGTRGFPAYRIFVFFSGLDQFLQKFDVNIHDRWRLACREKKQRERKSQFSIKRKFSWFSWKVQPPPTFANFKRNFSMKLVGTNKQVKKGLEVTWQLIHIIRNKFFGLEARA